jgi:hypothetical protein
MTKKQLKIFFILFIFCILGASLFYLLDKGKQKEIENQAVLNSEEISLVLLNSHSSPQAQSNWTVSFETKGVADLTITPDDPGTINHLDFVSLFCDEEERTAQILDDDVISYPDWSCEGKGKVTHLVNIAGHHTLVFQFGNQTAYAYNNPDAVTDTFDNKNKISTSTNLEVSGGQVTLAESKKTVIYITTALTTGNLGGRTEADTFCTDYKPSNLPATCINIRAFLSVTATDEIQDMPDNYSYTSTTAVYWWHNSNQTYNRLATSWADMLDGEIEMSQETGTGVAVDGWTGTTQYGVLDTNCLGWTSLDGADLGTLGLHSQTTGQWLDSGATYCEYEWRVMCLCEE